MADPIRVLYVDDDANAVGLRKELLERAGDFEVHTETNVEAGLARLDEEPIDCVLSDLEMAGMDGLSFLAQVREDHPDLPFILFSVGDDEEAVEEAIDRGVTDYVPKSTAALSYRLVANRIRNAVSLGGSANAGSQSTSDGIEDTSETATAIREAVGSETEHSPTARDDGAACAVPGCDFVADYEEELRQHMIAAGGDRDIDARLHRRLGPRGTNGTYPSAERPSGADPVISPGPQRQPDAPDGGELDALSDTLLQAVARGLGIQDPGRMSRPTVIEAIGDALADGETTAPDTPVPGTSQQRSRPGALSNDDLRNFSTLLERMVAGEDEAVEQATADEAPDAGEPNKEDRPAELPETEDSESDEVFTFSFERESSADEEDASSEQRDEGALPEVEPEPGTNTLIKADTHSTARGALCDRHLELEELTERNVVLVRYRGLDLDRIDRIAVAADRVHLIAVGSEPQLPDDLADRLEVTTVDKPDALRRLGIVLTRVVEDWGEAPVPTYVCFNSLHVVLRYAGVQRVFRFLHLLLGKFAEADAITHFHIDPGGEDPQDVQVLATLFDDVIDTAGELTAPT